MGTRMIPFTPLELDVIPSISECSVHFLIGERPATVLIVQVVATVLEKYTNWLSLGVSYQPWVVVAAADVRESYATSIRAHYCVSQTP